MKKSYNGLCVSMTVKIVYKKEKRMCISQVKIQAFL